MELIGCHSPRPHPHLDVLPEYPSLTPVHTPSLLEATPSASAMSDELLGVVQSRELTVARLREAAAAAPKAAWTAADRGGMTPLHRLMMNRAVTAEMVRAVAGGRMPIQNSSAGINNEVKK